MPHRAAKLVALAAGAAVFVLPTVPDGSVIGAAVAKSRDNSGGKRAHVRRTAKPSVKREAKRGPARRWSARRTIEPVPQPVAAAAPAIPSRPAPDAAASARPSSAGIETTASITAVPSDGWLERMRPALEARARAMATGEPPLVLPPPPDLDATPRGLLLRSVTFDLETGLKTTVFDDGGAVSERLDPAVLRSVAKLRPTSR